MNFFLRCVLLMSVCFGAIITITSAAPQPPPITTTTKSATETEKAAEANNQKSAPEKRDIKPSAELEEIFADDTKRKRSQEVIMFGNQQNKPAGMVDDGLMRFAEKKSQQKKNTAAQEEEEEDEEGDHLEDKEEENVLQDENEEIDEQEDENEDQDQVLPSKINVTRGNLNAPIVAEIGSEIVDTKDTRIDDKSRNGFAEEDPDNLPKTLLPPSQYEEEEEEEEEEAGQEEPSLDPRYFSRMNEQDFSDYGNRYYSGDAYRRNIRKRSLLTPLDKLMNSQHGSRWKRDVRLSKGDVVGLLGILAAAERAKERQAARQHSLADLESAYLDSLTETRPSSDTDTMDEFSVIGDKMNYLPIRYEGRDDEFVPEEVPAEWTVYEPESGLELRRRSPFYPPVDYRALGVIGNRKRSSSPRHPGLWGRFEERKRFLQKGSDLEDFGRGNGEEDGMGAEQDEEEEAAEEDEVNEEENGDGGTGHDEELYTLGELLNGNQVDDTRYPVYRRLI